MKSLSRSLRGGLLVVLASGLAMANTATFSTPAGSTTGGGAVSAQASFTTAGTNATNGTVTIDLTNLLTAAQVDNVGQNLSDLAFTLSGTFASGLVNDTNRTYSGKLVDVGTGGAVTTNAGNGIAASYNRWFFTNTNSTFTLEDLGAGQPEQTILGGTTSTTTYSGANNSIVNNDPHNPFLQGPVHFVLTIAGVTAATNITGATFSFGTALCSETATNCVPGTLNPVPEPRFVSLLLIGAVLSAAAYYRKKLSVQ